MGSSLSTIPLELPLSDSSKRGQKYLDQNAKHFMAETETELKFKDNFVELLILEATGNWYETLFCQTGCLSSFIIIDSSQESC